MRSNEAIEIAPHSIEASNVLWIAELSSLELNMDSKAYAERR